MLFKDDLLFGHIMNGAELNSVSTLHLTTGDKKNNDRQQQSVQTINLELIPKSENAHLPYTIKR